MISNESLANLVYVFHLLVVIFVLFAPFTGIPAILILHITFCISMIVHWGANSNICSLSVLESQLRGLDRTKTFTHQLIAPIYDISETEWSMIVHTITYLILGYSMYTLYHSDKFQAFLRELGSISSFADFVHKATPLFQI